MAKQKIQKGTHTALGLNRLWQLLRGKRVTAPTGTDPYFLHKGTPNFINMATAGNLLWAYRYGTAADQALALQMSREVLQSQVEDGPMNVRKKIEQGASDPHAGFHLAPLAAFRLAGREFKLAELLTLTGAIYRQLISYYRLISCPDGQVLGPGFRGLGGPFTQVGTMLFREVLGLPHRKPVGPGEGGAWDQWRFAGAGVVRKLLRDGDDLGAAAKIIEPVHLKVPVTVTRFGHGHLAVMANKNVGPNAVDPIDWVHVLYGPNGKHEVTWGMRWKTKPPVVPQSFPVWLNDGPWAGLKAERIQ